MFTSNLKARYLKANNIEEKEKRIKVKEKKECDESLDLDFNLFNFNLDENCRGFVLPKRLIY